MYFKYILSVIIVNVEYFFIEFIVQPEKNMHLTQHTDYALRILIYLSLRDKQTRSNISEIVDCFSIPRNHVVKIVHKLGKLGFIKTTRGKGGGIQLKHDAEKILIGDVVRKMEVNLEIVNCNKPLCTLKPACQLKGILDLARDAFLTTLDKYSLADINQQPALLLLFRQNETHQKSALGQLGKP